MKLNILVAVLAISATALAQTGGAGGGGAGGGGDTGGGPATDSSTTPAVPTTTTTTSAAASTTTASTTSAAPTTSIAPPTTSAPPSSSSAPASSSAAPSSSSSVAPTSKSVESSIQPSTSVVFTSAQTTVATSSTPTATSAPSDSGSSSDKTGIIAGATVGGIVGLALIAGILTWINRKGGCTRRRQRDSDFEDYGMEDNDFPPRPMASASAAAAAAGAGAMASPRQQEPTLPQFGGYDEQYNNSARRFVPSYQPQLQQHPDYYGQQQGGQYYNYPGSDQGYSDTTYNDQNYYGAGGAAGAGYYDSKTTGSSDAYKPDDAVENKPHEKM